MKSILNYVAARLKERSTWLGLIGLMGSVGISINPAYADAIIAIGVGAASLLAMLTADTKQS